jgi:HEAT repeat protein
VDPDPDVDLSLAVLGVLAGRSPPAVDAIAAFTRDPSARVRWDAVRLLGQITPDHPARAAAAADPDPLVRARATSVCPPVGGTSR